MIQILSCVPAFATTYRLSVRPFHKTCRNVFTISDLRIVVMTSSLCGDTKIDQSTRSVHLSDKFIYSFKQISNIKYSYFIGLCRYKSRDTLRKQKTTVSKWRLLSQGKLRGRIRRKYRFEKADDRKVNNNKEKVHSIPHQQ